MRLPVRVLLALFFGFTAAHAQTSDAHERDVHRESERNTQYHNNADDYNFKSGPATPAASTGNYHDYRKDAANWSPPTSYVPSVTQFRDFWFGRVIAPPSSYSTFAAFQLHLDRARQGDIAEMMYVAQMSYKGSSYKTSDGQTNVLVYKNLPLAYHYYVATVDKFPYSEYMVGAMQYYGSGATADCVSGLAHMQRAAARGEEIAVTSLATMQLPVTGPLPASPKDCAAVLSAAPKKTYSELLGPAFDYLAPHPATGAAAPPSKLWILSSEMVFASAEEFVWAESRPEVARIAEQLKARTGRYEVASYTEGDARTPSLSIKRADQLREALIEAGVPADRLVAKGYGDTKQFPGRNERVEIKPLD